MNIIVRKYGRDSICCRPDTTWERENRDFFSPDFISSIAITPIVFARIAKAGKCVGQKFAERYYDCINFGILLSPLRMADGTEPDEAYESCFDRTSILPFPAYNRVVFEDGKKFFSVSVSGTEVFDCKTAGCIQMLEDAIVFASKTISLRTGDIIAAELSGKIKTDGYGSDENQGSLGSLSLKGTFAENEIFSFRIIRDGL